MEVGFLSVSLIQQYIILIIQFHNKYVGTYLLNLPRYTTIIYTVIHIITPCMSRQPKTL